MRNSDAIDRLNYFCNDVFILGMCILEAAILKDTTLIYRRSSNMIEKDILKQFIDEFHYKYGEDSLPGLVLPKMLEIDPQKRPDFMVLKSALPPYKDLILFFQQNAGKRPMKKNPQIVNQILPSQHRNPNYSLNEKMEDKVNGNQAKSQNIELTENRKQTQFANQKINVNNGFNQTNMIDHNEKKEPNFFESHSKHTHSQENNVPMTGFDKEMSKQNNSHPKSQPNLVNSHNQNHNQHPQHTPHTQHTQNQVQNFGLFADSQRSLFAENPMASSKMLPNPNHTNNILGRQTDMTGLNTGYQDFYHKNQEINNLNLYKNINPSQHNIDPRLSKMPPNQNMNTQSPMMNQQNNRGQPPNTMSQSNMFLQPQMTNQNNQHIYIQRGNPNNLQNHPQIQVPPNLKNQKNPMNPHQGPNINQSNLQSQQNILQLNQRLSSNFSGMLLDQNGKNLPLPNRNNRSDSSNVNNNSNRRSELFGSFQGNLTPTQSSKDLHYQSNQQNPYQFNPSQNQQIPMDSLRNVPQIGMNNQVSNKMLPPMKGTQPDYDHQVYNRPTGSQSNPIPNPNRGSEFLMNQNNVQGQVNPYQHRSHSFVTESANMFKKQQAPINVDMTKKQQTNSNPNVPKPNLPPQINAQPGSEPFRNNTTTTRNTMAKGGQYQIFGNK